jgi:hypothetical protein
MDQRRSGLRRAALTVAALAAVALTLGGGTAHAQDETIFTWDFNGGNLDPAQQIGGTVSLSFYDAATQGVAQFGNTGTTPGVPDLPDGPANYYFQPTLPGAGNGGLALDFLSGVTANGPGSPGFVNNYSLMFDICLPSVNWTALFNTNDVHGNDADWYIAPDGSLGIGQLGYSPANTIVANTWYRLAFVHNASANTAQYFVNGVEVFSSAADSLDGRFSVFGSAHAGADLLLFGEGDGSGNYTNDLYLSSLLFADYALSAATIEALGGPTASGIRLNATAVPEPGTLTLAGVYGLTVLALARRRRRPRA